MAPLRARREMARLRADIEANPANAAAHNDLGRILALSRRFAEALPHWRRPRALARLGETGFFLGYALLATGKETEGLPLVEEALAAKPRMRYGEPYRLIGDVYLRAGRFAEGSPGTRPSRGSTRSVEGSTSSADVSRDRRKTTGAARRGTPWPPTARPALHPPAQRLWYLKAAWRNRVRLDLLT